MFGKFILLITLIPAIVLATNFTPCPGRPTPASVEITGCPSTPCRLKRGDVIDLFQSFTVRKFCQFNLIIQIFILDFNFLLKQHVLNQ